MQAVQQPPDARMKRERESIHSGQFMVSTFEAEEQDDEDEVAVPIPEEAETNTVVVPVTKQGLGHFLYNHDDHDVVLRHSQQQLSIDTSLAKLFQCMSLAYRQKLTSPKWNRFRGIRLRWKDKIRLNNVIWRCWHLQFIKKENTLICQFASPLDVDTHNKPEAVVLEGKYWKRKLAAVTAEYKKWRMFYRNHASGGHFIKDDVEMLNDMDLLSWNSQSAENMHMMVDEDYMGLMSDTLFSTITNQPFVFPDSREIARAGLADLIQPSLGPLQPNLEDYMDTFEPLQDFMSCKLPTVPEEQSHHHHHQHQTPQPQQVHHTTNNNWNYTDLDLITSNSNLQEMNHHVQNTRTNPVVVSQSYQQLMPMSSGGNHLVLSKNCAPEPSAQTNQNAGLYTASMMAPSVDLPPPPPSYQRSVIAKSGGGGGKNAKMMSQTHQQQQSQGQTVKINHQNTAIYSKNMLGYHTNYQEQNIGVTMQDQASLVVQQQQSQQQQFEIVSHDRHHRPTSGGYNFSMPSVPNMKFTTTQPATHAMATLGHSLSRQNDDEGLKSVRKQRSRSNTREPGRRPPLTSAISDPALLTPAKSVLLTQLLSNSEENFYNRGFMAPSQEPPKSVRIKKEKSPIRILPQPPPPPPPVPATLIITTTPVNISALSSDPLMMNSYSSSNSPVMDTASQNINSPTSSQGSIGSPNRENPHRDSKRVGHIHAEQKRRYNIKNGFDMIHSLIPHLNQNPNAKLSKAAMLQKGAEYIRQLRSERNQLSEEMECLRQQIETLNTSISNCQSMLPATGAPVSRRRDSKMQEMFDDYVRKRTMDNWKYWIFSLLFRPLLDSFNNFVSTSSLDDLYRSTISWIEQHCTLVDLRPVVLNSLKYLSTRTDILSEPEKLPDEVRQMVLAKKHK